MRNIAHMPVAVVVVALLRVPADAQEWQSTGAPNLIWQAVAVSADASRLVVIGTLPGTVTSEAAHFLYSSIDWGATWGPVSIPAQSVGDIALSADGKKWLATAGTFGAKQWQLLISTNAGVSWKPITAALD